MNASPSAEAKDGARTTARPLFAMAFAGAAIAFGAFVSYFVIVPRWEGLRDSGHLNVALAALGALLSGFALVRAFRARSARVVSFVLAGVAVASLALLAGYIYVLSYELPPASNALAVGGIAPAFRLEDSNGTERSLGELLARGAAGASTPPRWVLLVFFRGPW